jgi:hypothetical protein
MSHRNAFFRRQLAGALAAAMLLAADVIAQTSNGIDLSPNQAPELAVTLEPGEFVGHEQVIREHLRSGTNEFMFVVPDGLRTETAPDGKIVLITRDMSYYVSLRVVSPPPTSPELKDALREQIVSQYAPLYGLQEFTTTVADREGTGFQLRQDLPKVGGRLIRILWMPFNAGVLEFALNADNHNLSAGQGAFDMILLTFRSNERGRIEIVRRSDKT